MTAPIPPLYTPAINVCELTSDPKHNPMANPINKLMKLIMVKNSAKRIKILFVSIRLTIVLPDTETINPNRSLNRYLDRYKYRYAEIAEMKFNNRRIITIFSSSPMICYEFFEDNINKPKDPKIQTSTKRTKMLPLAAAPIMGDIIPIISPLT